MAINNDQLKKFKEALADIIVSSQGLCTYDACKDVAEREATFLISMLLPEPNIQSSNIKETIRAEIERRKKGNMYDELPMTIGRYFEDRDILAFLDSLPEQPVGIHIDNPNIEKVDPSIKVETRTDGTGDIDGKAMLYVADKSYKIGFRDGKASKEQPVEGLEEEINKEIDKLDITPGYDRLAAFARHFAEWGAEHLKK